MNGNRALIILVILAATSLGGLAAVVGFTFMTAHGTAHLSNDPQACVNCHVMRDQFDGWQHSSHHAVAVCHDCHLPHESVAAK